MSSQSPDTRHSSHLHSLSTSPQHLTLQTSLSHTLSASPASYVSGLSSPTSPSSDMHFEENGEVTDVVGIGFSNRRDRDRKRTSSTQWSTKSARSFLSWTFGAANMDSNERLVNYSTDIRDYELLTDIGGIDDISFLYLAKYIPTGESVALKYTDLTLSPDFELIDEVVSTIRNTSICRHPNILPYLQSFVENERLWTVTLPMKAGSCKTLLKKYYTSGFNEVLVATILKYVLKGLVYLHDRKLIHNDIRADNVLLDFNGQVRITGVRQMVSLNTHGENIQSVWTVVGENLEWAAPEIIAQNANYDEKADIYSFGITALELAFNRTPFDDWAPLRMLLSKVKYDIPAFDAPNHLSKQFYRLVQLCTQKDPTWRPSARDLYYHPFFKQAKDYKFLETNIIKKCPALYKKFDGAMGTAKGSGSGESMGSSPSGRSPST